MPSVFKLAGTISGISMLDICQHVVFPTMIVTEYVDSAPRAHSPPSRAVFEFLDLLVSTSYH